MPDEPIRVFGGSASRKLTEGICAYLGETPGVCETLRYHEGNLLVRIGENVRGRDVYLVQSVAFPTNDNFMELLFWIDAFKRASASSVTAIVPYFSYAKGDKKDEPRVSIRARVCADAIEQAGVSRVVTMDLHAAQVQGFFRVPVDDLYARPVLSQALRELDLPELVIVSPDHGFAKKARHFARKLGVPLAIADKERLDQRDAIRIGALSGEVSGRTAVIVDDFTVSGGTLARVAEELVARGARRVLAAITHGVFTQPCMDTLEASPIERLLVTDTIETQPVAPSGRVQVVSAAPLIGEAIKRIHTRQSISVLFDD